MTPLASIERLLRPKNIAVVGGGLAAAVIKQCKIIGFPGEIWPVNARRADLGGIPCFPSIDEIPGVPDATFIAVPRDATIEVLTSLSKMGAGGAVCYASGFGEMGGEEGDDYDARLKEAMGDMAIVGPNCYGVLNYLDRVTLWPDEQGGKQLDKGVAIIAQSGNIGISMTMQQRGVPIAYLISTGNQAGVTIPEYIEALLLDERVTAIGIHLEGLDDVQAFARAAINALKKKVPIVVIKAGATDLGSQIAVSHTSTLAGADALYNALFERVGIARVNSIPELLETLKFLSIVGPLPSNKMATISCSGGEAGLAADRGQAHGMTFPPLRAENIEALRVTLDERVALGNPLDYHTYIWGDEEKQRHCFASMMGGDQSITLKILDFPRPDICDPELWVMTARAFCDATHDAGSKGAVMATMTENLPAFVHDELIAKGVAPMMGLEETLVALRVAATVFEKQQVALLNADDIRPILPASLNEGEIRTLDEVASKQWLSEFGIVVPISAEVTSATAAAKAAEIGYPVVLKVLSDEIVHKSDVGGVHVNLKNAADVEAAVASMAHLGDRFLVEQMAAKPVTELILGLTRDPQFGLALVIGAGGVLVELFKDSKTLLLPTSRSDVEAALAGLKIAPLLDGYRGQVGADKGAIVDAVMGLASFAEAGSAEIIEVDINPLFAMPEGRGAVAVDGVIRVVE